VRGRAYLKAQLMAPRADKSPAAFTEFEMPLGEEAR
jgi:hypothetical protein